MVFIRIEDISRCKITFKYSNDRLGWYFYKWSYIYYIFRSPIFGIRKVDTEGRIWAYTWVSRISLCMLLWQSNLSFKRVLMWLKTSNSEWSVLWTVEC